MEEKNEKKETQETNVKRNYKDTVFRMLFQEKEHLLSLYNALNQTTYTDVGGLEIATLENALYMNYKNDIAFVFDFELMLYEHQSTLNPNMPFRNLLYVTKILQGLTKDENLYGPSLLKLPAPRFAVFYNGTDKQPEKRTLRLSEAYWKHQARPELELTVTVYNINRGQNPELLGACRLLGEYAEYVERVRAHAKTQPFPEAVERAVDECIKEGILAEFLSKNRAEAISMSIFEYDEEKHLKSVQEWGYQKGLQDGMVQGEAIGLKKGEAIGQTEGERRLSKLLQTLMDTKRDAEVSRVIFDAAYREQLYQEFQL